MTEGGRGAIARLNALDDVTRAILFMGLAAAMSSVLHVGVRVLSHGGMPSPQIVFLRTLLTILLTLPIVFRPGQTAWRTTVPYRHIVRGAIGTLSMWAWYHALGAMPLADAVTLGQTTGLFIVIGAAVWFGERVGMARGCAVAAGMLGAVIVLKPGAGVISWPAIIAIVSSALWALSLLMAKDLARHDPALTVTFYQPLTIAPWALVFALPVWVTPKLSDMALLVLMGLTAGISNYASIRALSLAPAAVTVPVDYTKLLWSMIAAYTLFGEIPGTSTWIGGAMIVAATLFIALHERRR